MRYHRQDTRNPGNCLQTCLACILDEPIAAVPAQSGCETFDEYLRSLGAFLRTRALWFERHDPQTWINYAGLAFREYVTVGIVQGSMAGASEEHCCVARNGGIIWDPYPTHPNFKRIDSLLLIRKLTSG